MPVYCYKCRECKYEFEIRHSMKESCSSCPECKSEEIFKVPSIQQLKKTSAVKKPGKIVDQFIQDTKKEITLEKRRMKREEY